MFRDLPKPTLRIEVLAPKAVKLTFTYRMDLDDTSEAYDVSKFEKQSGDEARNLASDFGVTIRDAMRVRLKDTDEEEVYMHQESVSYRMKAVVDALLLTYVEKVDFDADCVPADMAGARTWIAEHATMEA